jgi:multidrug efflux pump subunit AcrA (membrane-fusion protein)
MNMKSKTFGLILVAGLTGAVLGVSGWTFLNARATGGGYTGQAAPQPERKILYWQDPMVPGKKFDKPGKSPFMDMELVPVYADEASTEDAGVVTVRPEVANNLGVRTAQVTRSTAPRRLETDGYVFRDAGSLAVLIDVFARDAGWVRRGLAAEVRFPDLGAQPYAGSVAQVSPDIDIGARSFKAQVRITKPDPSLKANMYAAVTVIGPRPAQGRLLIPREALIRTGTRTSVVLALGEGRFKPVDVVPGPEIGEHMEIVKGLEEGDRVVTSGQFLLDSEANVRAAFSRMESGDAAPPPVPGHSSHEGH